jgi:IclR family acetate operon transcriptional repressor
VRRGGAGRRIRHHRLSVRAGHFPGVGSERRGRCHTGAVAEVPSGTVQSVNRALLLLELLAQGGGRLPVSELAQRSGLSLGTAHRLLTTLTARGYVRQDHDRRYALGAALLPLGDAARRLLSSWALPLLSELAQDCGETVNLAVLEDDHVVYVAQAPGRHRMRMFTQVGRRVLPHSTAVGKVLLAWHEEDQLSRVISRLGMPRHTSHTLTSLAAFRAELEGVRKRGWAVDDEEQEMGVRCLAVPVGPGADAVAAVSVSAPASRLDPGRPEVVEALHRTADQLARAWLRQAPDESRQVSE